MGMRTAVLLLTVLLASCSDPLLYGDPSVAGQPKPSCASLCQPGSDGVLLTPCQLSASYDPALFRPQVASSCACDYSWGREPIAQTCSERAAPGLGDYDYLCVAACP